MNSRQTEIEIQPPPPVAISATGFTGPEAPTWDYYSKCIHCGLCLNNCPTYRLLGVEMDSPRGRIRQMILVDQGRLKLSDSFVKHIDQCLDCRACETACPSGVQYGVLVEAARGQIVQHYRRPLVARLARRLVFHELLPHPKRIRALGRVLRFYQHSGLQTLVRATHLASLVGMKGAEALLPPVSDRFFFDQLGKAFPAIGQRRFRVAFFAGCLAQIMFNELNEATVRVLVKNGCEVVIPSGQLCCGALAVHAGERDLARRLARKNMEVFLGESFDAIITNAAGCGSTLKGYETLFPVDGDLRERSAAFSRKVKDVTEFLAAVGLTQSLRETRLRVTYQDSCHLAHGQKIKDAPRELLRMVPGVELVEMFNADHCCGSAGIYNVQQPEISLALLDEKMIYAQATRADVLLTANPGCMLQLRAGVARARTGQQVMHVVELLDQAST